MIAMEQTLFIDHVGEAMRGGSKGVEEGQGLVEVGDAVAEFKDAAGDGAQHGDLGGEVGGLEGVEVIELRLAEVTRVEAVSEGVGIAGLGTAFTGSGRGHGRFPHLASPGGRGIRTEISARVLAGRRTRIELWKATIIC